MTTIETLAERIEREAGPDRELDAEIYVAVDAERDNLDALAINGEVGSWVPAYTVSLDAAMTLVPENSWVRMDEWPREFCAPVASVQPIRDPKVAADVGTGTTLALALCAAALRAIANQQKDEPDADSGGIARMGR